MKSIFPTNEKEKRLVEFIGRYQYILSTDAKYFFNDTYYPKRITRLVKNNILRRYKKYLVLAEDGYNFLKLEGKQTNTLIYRKQYADRIKYMSHLAAVYNQENNIEFIPSFEIKDKNVFTESARRYIGILKIYGAKYLIYHISNEHSYKYVNSIIYDLQKEKKYRNAIVLIDDISRIDIGEFAFGLNTVLIAEDNDSELERLKYVQRIDWNNIVENLYDEKIFLSEYSFCDYTNKKDKFITIFYVLDAEKINRINIFMRNNRNQNAEIICDNKTKELLHSKIPLAKYRIVDIEKFIDKELKIYE